MTGTTPEPNRLRRAVGAVVCGLPLALAVGCLLWPRELPADRRIVGLVLAWAAVAVAVLNIHLAVIRPWLYRLRHRTMEGYRFRSGLPLVSTLLLVAGCTAGFGSGTVGLLALAAGLADPAGLPWVPVVTWKDASFWDE